MDAPRFRQHCYKAAPVELCAIRCLCPCVCCCCLCFVCEGATNKWSTNIPGRIYGQLSHTVSEAPTCSSPCHCYNTAQLDSDRLNSTWLGSAQRKWDGSLAIRFLSLFLPSLLSIYLYQTYWGSKQYWIALENTVVSLSRNLYDNARVRCVNILAPLFIVSADNTHEQTDKHSLKGRKINTHVQTNFSRLFIGHIALPNCVLWIVNRELCVLCPN
jgi:hypothetical protein